MPLTATLNKLSGRSLAYQAVVIPTCSNKGLVVCYQLRNYSSKLTGPPTPTSDSVPEVSKKSNRKKVPFLQRIKPAHSDIPDDEPRITEHMIMEAATTKHGIAMTFEEKVKENTKTMGYAGIMIVGLCMVGSVLWFVVRELFYSDSPSSIYSDSFKLVKSNTEVQDALGLPITCHGEETRRGWRRHVLHQEFLSDNAKLIRMKYYLNGKFRKATVTLEKRANLRGKYDHYSYLVVELDGYPSRLIEIDTD